MSFAATLSAYRHVVILDAEYVHTPGERHDPVCLGWKEYGEGRVEVARREEICRWRKLPFPVGSETLCVAYNAGADASFLWGLDVPQPAFWFDVMVEEGMLRNVAVPGGVQRLAFAARHPELVKPGSAISLLEAARLYGVECGEEAEKEYSRNLILSRAWEDGEESVWRHIEQYCAEDVQVTEQLFAKLEFRTVLPQAVKRGSFAAEVGRMGQRGIPADGETYQRLREFYRPMLIRYRSRWDVDGSRLTPKGGIRAAWWEQKLEAMGALQRYPRTKTGKPSTALTHVLRVAQERQEDAELVGLAEWRQLRTLFPERKEGGLRGPSIGQDGRFRYDIFAFGTHTGRSLGSGKEAVMQLPAWFRGLIRPGTGEVLVYCDFEGQEVAIAAALSGDQELRKAYENGDVYHAIAEMAGAITPETSEEEARRIRKAYKILTLGKFYGMSFKSFARQSQVSHDAAARAWRFFERRFNRLGSWQQSVITRARAREWIQSTAGWRADVYPDTKRGTLLNWPIQSAGADVLQMSVLRVASEGFAVLALAYDALLVSVPESGAEARIAQLREIITDAADLLVGIRIRIGCQVIRPGERFLTPESQGAWEQVMQALEEAAANL